MGHVTEHDEQVAFFDYVRMKAKTDERYKMIYAVPNAGKRSFGALKYYQAEGLEKGVLDINVDVPAGEYHGLRIEMKGEKGALTAVQRDWMIRYRKFGYAAGVARSSQEAIKILGAYLGLQS